MCVVSMPCARLGWPSHEPLSAHKYTAIVSYRVVSCNFSPSVLHFTVIQMQLVGLDKFLAIFYFVMSSFCN